MQINNKPCVLISLKNKEILKRSPISIKILSLGITLMSLFSIYYLHYGWEGAYIRVLISALTAFSIFVIILLKMVIIRKVYREILCTDVIILGTIPILLYGVFIGVIKGAYLYDAIAEFYPFIEFVIYYVLLSIIITDQEDIILIIKFILFSSVITSTVELYLYFTTKEFFFFPVSLGGQYFPRINDFNAAFTFPLIIGIACVQWKHIGFLKKVIYTLSTLILASIILLGYFRSQWLSVSCGVLIIFFLVLKSNHIRDLKPFTLLLCIIIIISIFSYLIFKPAFSKLFIEIMFQGFGQQSSSTSIISRMNSLKLFLTKISGYTVIFGEGLGTLITSDISTIFGKNISFFNLYLTLIYKLGLVGSIILLTPLIMLFIYSHKILKLLEMQGATWELEKGITIGLLGGTVSILVTFLFFASPLRFLLMVYLAMSFVSVLKIGKWLKKNRERGIRQRVVTTKNRGAPFI